MTETTLVPYDGGCHCGRVRFRIHVPADGHDAIDCNCSVCTKKGIVHVIVPESRFSLLSGEDELTTYTFGTGVAKHLFCRTCGMHPFYRPRSHPDHWDVNLRCLDGDAMTRFRVTPFDGRNWEENVEAIR